MKPPMNEHAKLELTKSKKLGSDTSGTSKWKSPRWLNLLINLRWIYDLGTA